MRHLKEIKRLSLDGARQLNEVLRSSSEEHNDNKKKKEGCEKGEEKKKKWKVAVVIDNERNTSRRHRNEASWLAQTTLQGATTSTDYVCA